MDIFFSYIVPLFFLPLWETVRCRRKYCLKGPLNQPNPVVSGIRTPVYSCYHFYSKVSDKNACRSIDSDLITHSLRFMCNLFDHQKNRYFVRFTGNKRVSRAEKIKLFINIVKFPRFIQPFSHFNTYQKK